jgi:hypothetical protein
VPAQDIDRDKLGAAILRMGSDYIFYVLDLSVTAEPVEYV